MAVVDLEVSGAVATITLNRPGRLNAMDSEMAVRLIDAFDEVRRAEDVRAVILTGAGEAFCAGGDLDETIPLMTGVSSAQSEWQRRWMQVRSSGGPFKTDLQKPMIAAVNGHAVAGGMEMVMNCDIRISVPHAKFGIPEVKVGLFPGGGSTVRLPLQISHARAMEMLLTGDLYTAEEMHAQGFLNYIVPPADLLPRARAIAERIAGNGPLAVQAVRNSVRACAGMPEPQALLKEQEYSAQVHGTEDAIEGPRAFLEKRRPEFKGR